MQTAERMPEAIAITEAEPLLMTVKDTAKVLGISAPTVWRMISAGTLASRKIGARTLVTTESIHHVAENGA